MFIPKAALAAIVIESASGLFNWEEWTKIWKLKRVDMVPFLVTFAFDLEFIHRLILNCCFLGYIDVGDGLLGTKYVGDHL